VVADFHIGGNLRLEFPQARVIQIGYPPPVWPPPRGRGQCLLVWSPKVINSESAFAAYLTYNLGVAADAPRRDGNLSLPLPGLRGRSYRLNYRLYAESQGECR
jgi:hypothetical protein